MNLITNLKYNLRVYKFKKDYESRKREEMKVIYHGCDLCDKSLFVLHRMDDEVRLTYYLPLFCNKEERIWIKENNSERISNLQELAKEGIEIREENERRMKENNNG